MRSSRPQNMLDRSESCEVYFMSFTRVGCKENPVLFFEGDDDEKYYLSRIRLLTNNEFKSIACGGKKSVLCTRDKIKGHPIYSKYSNFYFVDSDFDDNSYLSLENDIYITPSYAIENFYVSLSCFKLILNSEFKCKESIDKNEYERLLDHFCVTRDRFLDKISNFNSFVHSYRNIVLNGDRCKLNLKNLDQNKKFIIVEVDENKNVNFSIKFDLNNIEDTFSNLNEEDINNSLANINISIQYLSSNREFLFRGKNLLWFVIKYLNILKDDVNSESPVLFTSRRSCSLEFSISTAISVLSQYADTPECLRKFIVENLS